MATTDMWNAQFIESQYKKWKDDPNAVTRDWQFFFKGFEIGDKGPAEDETLHGTLDAALQQSRVESLIYRYRDLGHLMACMDPLSSCPTDHPLLNLGAFGLSPDQLDTFFYTRRFSDSGQAKLKDIISHLTKTYCRSIGVEYMHLQDPAERRWLQKKMEPVQNRPELSAAEKTVVLEKLIRTGLFERFLNKKYPGQTRFSLEGAEVIVPMLHTLFKLGIGGRLQGSDPGHDPPGTIKRSDPGA
jgi:2-oxoglutarate dehydrogenase E1 component